MRQQIVTTGIVLSRTDFQEADRIVTLLTPDHGKLRVIAKGVRRPRSKLAGGIELFSVSHINVLPGRGELGTLVSTRLETHYGNIVGDIERTMWAYDLLKRLNKLTEDAAEPDYYHQLVKTLDAINAPTLYLPIIQLWFDAQLLKIMGHQPNLDTTTAGRKLTADQTYTFDYDNMCFRPVDKSDFTPTHIKFLRLAFAAQHPLQLQRIANVTQVLDSCHQLVQHVSRLYLRQ